MMAQPYPPARNRASAPSTAGGSAAGRGWRVSGAAPQLPGDRRTTVRTSLPATSVAGKSAGEHGAYQKEAALEDSANLGNTPDNSVLGPREGGQESPPASQPGWKRFAPAPQGQNVRVRPADPVAGAHGADSPGGQPAKVGRVTVPSAEPRPPGAGSFAHGPDPPRVVHTEQPVRPAEEPGRAVSPRGSNQGSRVPNGPENRIEIVRPPQPRVEREAPQVRNVTPVPKDAPRDGGSKKNN